MVSNAPGLCEVTCPMAKPEWLQTLENVADCMGKEMLDCGTVNRQGGTKAKEQK